MKLMAKYLTKLLGKPWWNSWMRYLKQSSWRNRAWNSRINPWTYFLRNLFRRNICKVPKIILVKVVGKLSFETDGWENSWRNCDVIPWWYFQRNPKRNLKEILEEFPNKLKVFFCEILKKKNNYLKQSYE